MSTRPAAKIHASPTDVRVDTTGIAASWQPRPRGVHSGLSSTPSPEPRSPSGRCPCPGPSSARPRLRRLALVAVLVGAARGRLCRRAGRSGHAAAAGQPDAGGAGDLPARHRGASTPPTPMDHPARERAPGVGEREGHHPARRRTTCPTCCALPGLQRPAVDPPQRLPRPDRTGRRRPSSTSADFYAGPLDQFRWKTGLWGLPDSASPEIVFFDKKAFADAGVAPPDDTWTYEDMRTAALKLTVDAAGKHPGRRRLRPEDDHPLGLERRRHLLLAGRGDPGSRRRAVRDRRLHDDGLHRAPRTRRRSSGGSGSSSTTTPGCPTRTAARRPACPATRSSRARRRWARTARSPSASSTPPARSTTTSSRRSSARTASATRPLSTNGYVMSAASKHPDEAWALVQALIAPAFLESTWGKPGHAVPARRSAASSVIDTSHAPANQKAILEAMEVGAVFRPYTAGARAAYDRTIDLFTKMNTGALPIPDALAQIEADGERRARGRPGAVILGRRRPGRGRASGDGRPPGTGRRSRPRPVARALVLPAHRAVAVRARRPPGPPDARRRPALSFADWEPPLAPRWVGLDNLAELGADPRFASAVANTIVYGLATVVPGSGHRARAGAAARAAAGAAARSCGRPCSCRRSWPAWPRR